MRPERSAQAPRRRVTRLAFATLALTAIGLSACFGPKAELRRRGIPIDSDQLVSRSAGGDAEVVDLLLRAKVPVDVRDAYGTTALLAACDSKRLEVVRLLLSQGADPDLGPADSGLDPLAVAAMRGQREIVGMLLAAGATPDPPGSPGPTALMMAALHGHQGVVTDLLEAGAAVAARDDTGWTALHHAARGGRAEVAHRLLAAGADPRLEDRDGWSALELAKSTGDWQVAAVFEEHMTEEARVRRTARLASGPLVLPPGWSVDDRVDARTSFWPEHAAFATAQDPPGSRRVLLRSPAEEEAQIFLILGRLAPWWDQYRDTVQRIESDPALESRRIEHLTTGDGVRLEVRRYRFRQRAGSDEATSRVMAFGETRGSWVLVVDAGGKTEAPGVERVEPVLRHSRLLEVVGFDKLGV